jgi:hypothetical protein
MMMSNAMRNLMAGVESFRIHRFVFICFIFTLGGTYGNLLNNTQFSLGLTSLTLSVKMRKRTDLNRNEIHSRVNI